MRAYAECTIACSGTQGVVASCHVLMDFHKNRLFKFCAHSYRARAVYFVQEVMLLSNGMYVLVCGIVVLALLRMDVTCCCHIRNRDNLKNQPRFSAV